VDYTSSKKQITTLFLPVSLKWEIASIPKHNPLHLMVLLLISCVKNEYCTRTYTRVYEKEKESSGNEVAEERPYANNNPEIFGVVNRIKIH
jgi:hypothetical protein